MSWSPGEEMLSESSEEEPEELESLTDPNAVDKFIVCQRWLLSLFTVCSACCGETQGHIMHPEGTFIKVKQACGTCGYERYWQNQEKVHRNMPACNLLLSGAIHFSGCMASQTIRMLKLFGLQCISPGTFFCHQRYYSIPTIMQAWRNELSLKNFSWQPYISIPWGITMAKAKDRVEQAHEDPNLQQRLEAYGPVSSGTDSFRTGGSSGDSWTIFNFEVGPGDAETDLWAEMVLKVTQIDTDQDPYVVRAQTWTFAERRIYKQQSMPSSS
ncbi:uncharacterized protein LOC127953072 [Carassius gibelio]|uniref:uncharacterized protein LOC127953072 n=1 Tax=Carassius gibelio TaxID=101364 RepID=UPI0022792740|nr:uncharacterized protein LOC127953072 [Carassius gibelio]